MNAVLRLENQHGHVAESSRVPPARAGRGADRGPQLPRRGPAGVSPRKRHEGRSGHRRRGRVGRPKPTSGSPTPRSKPWACTPTGPCSIIRRYLVRLDALLNVLEYELEGSAEEGLVARSTMESMSTATAVETGVYVYGITDAQDGLPDGPAGHRRRRNRNGRRRRAGRRRHPRRAPEDPRPAVEPGGPSQAAARLGAAANRAPLRLRHGGRRRRAVAGSPPL